MNVMVFIKGLRPDKLWLTTRCVCRVQRVLGQLSIEMEEVQIVSETKDERVGRDVNLGIEESNSNGHGRELDKEGHIMKIIEGLQRDAQARRADS